MGVFNDSYVIFLSDFRYKSLCCGCLFELLRLVEAIQMHTLNIYFCFYNKVGKSSWAVR